MPENKRARAINESKHAWSKVRCTNAKALKMNSEDVEVVIVDEPKTLDVIKDHVERGPAVSKEQVSTATAPGSGRALGNMSLWYCHAIP